MTIIDLTERVKLFRQQGMSHAQIAIRLSEEGVCTSSGGTQWHPSQVARILAGQYLKPRVKYDGAEAARRKEGLEALSALCITMKRVHGWDPYVESWIDRYGTQRLALRYASTDSDEPKTFLAMDNSKDLRDFNELVRQFVIACTDGL